MEETPASNYRWLHNVKAALEAMLDDIRAAKESFRLEMYIFNPSPTAEEFRRALIDACQRGVKTQVLADGLG